MEANGDLVISLEGGDVRFGKPVVYQPLAAISASSSPSARDSAFNRQESEVIEGHYILAATNEIQFEVPNYDRSRPLTIDPVLSYSTYLGGSNDDAGLGIAVDADGNAYVTGDTSSTDFPTQNPVQGATETTDVFVTKLNADGSGIVYSTYLGGSAYDQGASIALDPSGYAYVTGYSYSREFPTTDGAFMPSLQVKPWRSPSLSS